MQDNAAAPCRYSEKAPRDSAGGFLSPLSLPDPSSSRYPPKRLSVSITPRFPVRAPSRSIPGLLTLPGSTALPTRFLSGLSRVLLPLANTMQYTRHDKYCQDKL